MKKDMPSDKLWNTIVLYSRVLLLSMITALSINGLQADTFNMSDSIITCVPIPMKAEFIKTLKKEMPLAANGLMIVSNKHGRVEVNTWEKNRVKIEVNIVVHTGSEEKASDVFDRIHIEFSEQPNAVEAATQIESVKNNWWQWSDDNTKFEINYRTWMPANANIGIANKYGDVIIYEFGGEANVQLGYGDLTMHGISGNLDLNAKYSNILILNANNIMGEVAYSKVRVVKANDLNLTTKYSKLNLEQSNVLTLNSRYDNSQLGEINKLVCDAKYGDLSIEAVNDLVINSQYTTYSVNKIIRVADLNLRHGGIKVLKVADDFEEIQCVGKNADFHLKMEEDTDFQLDANGEYAGIKYPENIKIQHESTQLGHHQIKGYKGNPNGTSVIKVSLNYGGLRMD